jgi:hypothetical protein
MSKLLVVFECYIRLIAHDVFMRKHDLAALHQQIKNFPRRVARQTSAKAELACHALDIACVFYPKRALCLQRSSVLVKILRRRGVPARMVIGAQKLPFRAHAWVEVDGEIVNDRLASREKFLVLEVC